MQTLNQIRKYGPKVAVASATGLLLGTQAHAAGIADIFAAIDLTTLATTLFGLGVLIIGVSMAFKGVDLGKRAVKKV